VTWPTFVLCLSSPKRACTNKLIGEVLTQPMQS
jgi:hypothetical protein